MKTIANDLRTLLQNHYHLAAIEAEYIKTMQIGMLVFHFFMSNK